MTKKWMRKIYKKKFENEDKDNNEEDINYI